MPKQEGSGLSFLRGGGEMGELIRTKDWSETSIGSAESWPVNLKTAVSLLLNSKFPMFIWWGKDLTTIYNDAYRVIAGGKHPHVLGQSGRDAWAEIWPDLEPLVQQVLQGNATWSEDQLLYINRRGFIEDAYFTFSYSPLLDEDGGVAGLFCACIESTEKVVSTKRILESEKNLRNTILQSPVAMCIFKGRNYTVNIANTRMVELWGKSPEQVMHRPIFEGLPEARDQGLEELLFNVYTNGITYTANERPVLLPANGRLEKKYINFVYEPFREGDGSIGGIIAVAIDVTEQVLARKKIEESEQELQKRVAERTIDIEGQKALIKSVLDSSMHSILALDAVRNEAGEVTDFIIVQINRKFKEMTGLDESVIGRYYLDCFPDSVEMGVFDFYERVFRTGVAGRIEVFSTNLNLNAWFEISAAPRGEAGIVSSFANISPQREAARRIEEQKNMLDSIMSNSPVGISVYEAIRNVRGEVTDFRFVLSNEAAAEFTGLSLEERTKKTILEVSPHLRNSKLFAMAVEAVDRGTPFRTEYFREEIQKWLDLSVVRMYDNHLMNVFRDITPIKDVQLQLEKNIEDLKQSNANLEEFAYAASHDLKEPIRKIHFFCDRLKGELKDKLNDKQSLLFSRIEHAAKRMGLLVEDLLIYSHISRGLAEVEDIDLAEKVQIVLEDLELQVQEKNAVFNIGSLPVIRGHRRQIQQLFQNLISNSLKYSKPGIRPEIHITAKIVKGKDTGIAVSTSDLNKKFHYIEVRDNGIGFDQKDAERIFNVFTRLHGGDSRGSGVGLSIVDKVVHNHGGHVWAESTPGEGSIFKILLPA